MSFIPCFPMTLDLNVFDLNARNDFSVFLGVLQHHIQCLQSLIFWCFLLLREKKIMFNVAPLVFWTSFFYIPIIYCLFSFCHSLLAFLSFCYFPSFFILSVYSWCCLIVFLLLTKFKSFLKQNITQNWILIKDVQNKECLIG